MKGSRIRGNKRLLYFEPNDRKAQKLKSMYNNNIDHQYQQLMKSQYVNEKQMELVKMRHMAISYYNMNKFNMIQKIKQMFQKFKIHGLYHNMIADNNRLIEISEKVYKMNRNNIIQGIDRLAMKFKIKMCDYQNRKPYFNKVIQLFNKKRRNNLVDLVLFFRSVKQIKQMLMKYSNHSQRRIVNDIKYVLLRIEVLIQKKRRFDQQRA